MLSWPPHFGITSSVGAQQPLEWTAAGQPAASSTDDVCLDNDGAGDTAQNFEVENLVEELLAPEGSASMSDRCSV